MVFIKQIDFLDPGPFFDKHVKQKCSNILEKVSLQGPGVSACGSVGLDESGWSRRGPPGGPWGPKRGVFGFSGEGGRGGLCVCVCVCV